MTTWHALNKTDHRHAGYKKFDSYNHARNDTAAPLLAAELSQALPYYPLAFLPQGTSQEPRYQLVTLHSLQPGLNLYVNDQGQWLAPYVPSHYRSHPFKLVPNPQQNNALTLCFDLESGLVHTPAEPEDVPLFTPEGEFSEALSAILDFLQQCERNRHTTQKWVNQLAEQQLIVPWPIPTQSLQGEAETHTVQGLYQIDEQTLKQLPPQTASDLLRSGALGLAYAQLWSQSRMQKLQQVASAHAAADDKQRALDTQMQDLFSDDGGNLKFDF